MKMSISDLGRKLLASPKETEAIITHFGKKIEYTDDSYAHPKPGGIGQDRESISIEDAALLILRFNIRFVGDDKEGDGEGENPHKIKEAIEAVRRDESLKNEFGFLRDNRVIEFTG